MLLLMLERGWPIDAVLNADTGMEFPEMYEHLKQVDEHLFRERGLHITTLKSPKSFEYLMFDEPKQSRRALPTGSASASPARETAGRASVCAGALVSSRRTSLGAR